MQRGTVRQVPPQGTNPVDILLRQPSATARWRRDDCGPLAEASDSRPQLIPNRGNQAHPGFTIPPAKWCICARYRWWWSRTPTYRMPPDVVGEYPYTLTRANVAEVCSTVTPYTGRLCDVCDHAVTNDYLADPPSPLTTRATNGMSPTTAQGQRTCERPVTSKEGAVPDRPGRFPSYRPRSPLA